MRIVRSEPFLRREARVAVGCSAVVFDAEGKRVLLTRRTDNGLWCLPGGHVEVGESVSQCCIREVREETGLEVKVRRLLGVYSAPEYLFIYGDGSIVQMVALSFLCDAIGGRLAASPEVDELEYVAEQTLSSVNIVAHHRVRVDDAFEHQRLGTIVR